MYVQVLPFRPLTIYRRIMLVHVTGNRFHLESCFSLKRAKTVSVVELSEVRLHPCRRCFPDAPRLRVLRRYCPKCNKQRIKPCAHNGGVLVKKKRRFGSTRARSEELITYHLWVWPEDYHLHAS